jgi:acetolactate decarboxylase
LILDERLTRHLHVESLRRRDLHPEHDAHVLFQASTIGALLDGAYDGDVSFAELAGHGDLGLGTLTALDGEMIAIDGRFFRADVDGHVTEVAPEATTPFAVMCWFEPAVQRRVDSTLEWQALLAELELAVADADGVCAIRVDGEFDSVRARSVPAQKPPYRPLAEVIADQHVFELGAVSGSLVGFRFPEYAAGFEVGGFHLHFIADDRRRGGHALDCRLARGEIRIDLATGLHVELPPGIELESPALDEATRAAIERVER